MIDAITIWGIATFIFVKFFHYPPDAAMSAFYVIAGFGLLCAYKNRAWKTIGKFMGEVSKILKGEKNENKEEE